MSCFDVKILDPDINTITIESCVGDQPSSIDIVTYDNTNILEISHCLSIADIKVKDILAGSGINIVTSSGIYTVSLSDTYLTSSDIADFLESVQDIIGQSGLSAGNYVNLSYNDSTGLTTISVTGLQPSGNYSVVGHTHITNDITNFASGVSGLLPSVTGSGYATSNFANNTYTISVTGLQPSGNYSLVGHTHLSSDITNFDIAVSGLIPPSNFTSLSGVSGITVSNSGTNYTVSLTDPTIQLADITDLSSNGRTFLLTPSSSNLATLITDETGSGSLVFNNSPALSGTPTVPTAPSGTNNTQIANTAFVRTEITNLVNAAPSTLDTLNELATALGNDPNFATTVTNSLASKAALNGAIFTGPVTIPSGTGNFDSLTVNGTGVSLSGHSHTSSNITDFSSSVSGLLPSVTGSGYVMSSFTNNTYTISVSGLQPSGNYSVIGHSHVIADVSGLQNILDGKQPSGIYASGVHYHISSDITDFNSSVSGLLPVKNIVGGSGIGVSSLSGIYTISTTGNFGLTSEEVDDRVSNLLVAGSYTNINYNDNANTLTISVTGLQPSGNYSVVGHAHTVSDISDFSSSVSGLLPVTNIINGTGIGISNSSGVFSINFSGIDLGIYSSYSNNISFAWGDNTYGQLGDGTTTQKNSPTPIVSGSWKSIATSTNNGGSAYTIAIKNDDTLWAWGDNTYGQLGDGTTIQRLSPVQIGSSNWKSVSIGQNHSLAIKNDDTLWAWGSGILGNGSILQSNSPIQIGSNTWKKVVCGGYHTLAIRSDNTLWSWGYNFNGQIGDGTSVNKLSPVQIGISTWSSISAGLFFSLAIKSDGSLWAWGSNLQGQLGDGSTTSRLSPVQIGVSAWKAIDAGSYHSLAIKSDNTLWVWGYNISGEIGDGTTTPRLSPVQIGTNSWNYISGGNSHSLAIRNDNTLWAWGNNGLGQLGDGTNTQRLSPIQIGSNIWNNVSAGGRYSLGVITEQTPITIPTTTIQNKRGLSSVLNYNNSVFADGELIIETDTNRFKIGDGVTNWNSLPYPILPDSSGLYIQNLIGTSGIQVTDSGNTRQISTNLISGNGIALTYNNDNSLTINTISNNGRILISDNITTNLTIPSGYVPGSLSIYQNGVKLLDSIDYTATNGSGIVFTNSPTSGTYIEYQTPTNTNNIQQLINNTLIAGSGIALNYNINNNTLTISSSGIGVSSGMKLGTIMALT